MNNKMKKLLSFLLCCVLVAALMPTVAFAKEAQEITEINISAPVAYRAGGAMPSISDITVADDAPYTVVGVQTTYLGIATTGPLTAGEKYSVEITLHPKDGYYFKSDYSGMYTEAEYTINGGLSSSGLTRAAYVQSEYAASLYPNARVGDAVVYYDFTALPMTRVTANTIGLNLYPGIFYETAKSIVNAWKLTENTILIYGKEGSGWAYFYYYKASSSAPELTGWATAQFRDLNHVLSKLDKNDVYILGTTKEGTPYTVTFDMNGHGTQVAAQTVVESKKAAKPADPTAEGYTFSGWYKESTCDTPFDFNSAITKDTTVYAKWTKNAPTYTVTFDMNSHGTQVAAQTIEEGSKAAKPTDPSESGWSFEGWYQDATFSAAFDFDTPITVDTTIYAKWEKITHAVYFNPVLGSLSLFVDTAYHGDTVDKPADPSAEGYRFTGWYTDRDCKNEFNFDTPITEDIELFAGWIKTYKVSFDMNSHGTQVAAQTIEEGSKAAKPTDPSESGWTFEGWYQDATFSAAFDFDTAITANTTIYAKWTKNTTPPDPVTYSIIAGANSEWTKGGATGLSFTSDAPFDKFDSVEVDGSTVASANYTAEAGSTKITLTPAYLETLSVGSHSIRIVSSDGSASTNFTVKAAAQPPVPTTYTVTFNMGGHGTAPANQTVNEGSEATKPADPTASGYTFGGWYGDATCSAKFDFNSAITADTTVYAKWTKNSSTSTDPTSPQTGDNSHMFLWVALLFISGGAFVGATVLGKKKRYSAK